ncbi:MAG: hypothetical protein MR522_07985 [Trueperella sp.]|uniref:hypothetical protein n=1 Tax=Trueperella sp. TaxID=2699835 RepID=UPI0025DCBD10|nr:hypothetical protein [Trueperella sp.]MCI7306182.1 hypothetical protein [Trueperella sp.]
MSTQPASPARIRQKASSALNWVDDFITQFIDPKVERVARKIAQERSDPSLLGEASDGEHVGLPWELTMALIYRRLQQRSKAQTGRIAAEASAAGFSLDEIGAALLMKSRSNVQQQWPQTVLNGKVIYNTQVTDSPSAIVIDDVKFPVKQEDWRAESIERAITGRQWD